MGNNTETDKCAGIFKKETKHNKNVYFKFEINYKSQPKHAKIYLMLRGIMQLKHNSNTKYLQPECLSLYLQRTGTEYVLSAQMKLFVPRE